MPSQTYDLVVIGAGPAGLSAAQVAAQHGLHVIVLDEFPVPGGRMLGQFHEEPGSGWWIGRDDATRLVQCCEKLGVEIRCGASVHGLEKLGRGFAVSTPTDRIKATYVLVATGAAETPAPLPGWTLPGVMSIGAAQVMTNVHYVKPGHRGIIIGVNVLAMAIASELATSGVNVVSIVLPAANPINQENATPNDAFDLLARLSHLAPSRVMRLGGKLTKYRWISKAAQSFFPRQGIRVWDIPLKLRTAAVSINGRERVESVTLIDLKANGEQIPGSEREEPVDFVAIAGGLYPLAELCAVAGCPFVHVEALGGYIPVHNEQMQTPVPHLYVAGNIAGVESAHVAMAQGQLAGTTICVDAGKLVDRREEALASAVEHVKQVRSSALIQFDPGIAAARRALYDRTQDFVPAR